MMTIRIFKSIALIAMVAVISANFVFAQINEAKILTSAQCGMCKTTIEKAVNKLEGIKTANLNVDDKYLIVTFDSSKLTLQKIRETVNKVGYDADSLPSDKRAYNKLSKCCKKPKDR